MADSTQSLGYVGNSQRTRPFADYWTKGTFKYGDVRGMAPGSSEPNTVRCYFAVLPELAVIRPVSHFRKERTAPRKRTVTVQERHDDYKVKVNDPRFQAHTELASGDA